MRRFLVADAFFQIEHEFPQTGRWYLNGLRDHVGNQLDVRDFTYGVPIETEPKLRLSSPTDGRMIDVVPPLTMSLRRLGPPLDFTLGDFDVPVATQRVAQLLARVAGDDIQRFLTYVDGHIGDYEIINVTSKIKCIDLQRSDITYWTEEDGLPDMVGKPQMIADLIINPALTEGRHLFRPEGWTVALIASNIVKEILEGEGVTGIGFRQVSGL
jgi:hypothetical protein